MRAIASSASHCAGVQTPPGMRVRIMKLYAGSSFCRRAFVAEVAVVLLVAAVELDELRVGLADRAGQRIGEALDQRAAQAAARLILSTGMTWFGSLTADRELQ